MALRRLSFLALIVLICFLGNGCKKSGNDGGYIYTITNRSNKAVNIHIYNSLNDYNNATNIYYKGVVASGNTLSLPYSQFVKGQTYYIDWFTDDFLYTNWFWTNVTVISSMALDQNYSNFVIDASQQSDPSRSIWMNGLNAQTVWKAVDAYSFYGGLYTSVWSSLPAAKQNVQLTLYKSFAAELTYTDNSNLAIDTVIRYRANYDTAAHVTLFGTDFTTIGTLAGNFNPATFAFNGNKAVMLAYLPATGYYYQMVRQ